MGGEERGVVTSCSYEARKMGVHSAMPSRKARQLCPDGIFVKGSYADYSFYSKWVTNIIAAQAPLFQKASVDEFYLDLTGMEKFFNPLKWTIALREEIMQTTGLPISFGLGSNKMIAKMATNAAKPNGYLEVPHGMELQFLAPLPVGDLPGVGQHTREILHHMDLLTIRDIQTTDLQVLEDRLGKWGTDLYQKSRGIHSGTVASFHEAKSISSEHTFFDSNCDLPFLKSELVRLTEKVCFELRSDGKLATCVGIKVRYPDFETKNRQITLAATASDDEIIPVVKMLFEKLYKKGMLVRLLGVKLSQFTTDAVQADLFIDRERKNKLYKAIDQVKNKFGKGSVKRASAN